MSLQKLLNRIFILAVVAFVASFLEKDHLPIHQEIQAQLLQEPAQTENKQAVFSFDYRGKKYEVEPVADYDLNGLVVSHNNISGIADVTHTKNSVDTKDVCVIWGPNLSSDDFRMASYSNADWTCYVQYPAGVSFHLDALANNHLITSDDQIRSQINSVHVGDQIHVTGWLVNYHDPGIPDWWRKSSLTRTDSGNGACEVVFVKKIEFLKRGAPGWHDLFTASKWALVIIPICKVVLFFLE